MNSEHKWCEPPRYPDTLGETWDCPECGLSYVAFDPTDDPWVMVRTTATGLGWKTIRGDQ